MRGSPAPMAVAVALVGLVAGCTGSTPSARPSPPADNTGAALMRQVAAATVAASTANFEVTVSSAGGGGFGSGTNTLHGAFDYAKHRGWYVILQTLDGRRSTDVTLIIGTTRYKATVYEAVETPDEITMPPDQWLKVDLPADFANNLAGEAGEPGLALVLLRDGATAARKASMEQIRGTQTTRYAVMLDLDRYAAKLPSESRNVLENYGIGGKTPADVWIDAQNRLRRLRFSYDGNVPVGTAGDVRGRIKVEYAIELFDFSVPVQVNPPPDSLVCDKPVCS
jgi:hypothetical protein